MLSLLKQCSSLGQLLTRSPVISAAPCSLAQSRGFWRLVDSRYTDPDNKLAKYPQPSIEQDDIYDSRQEMYKDGYGIKLYDLKDGQRKSLKAVVARFKRLDWGPWIRPRSGRAKKLWKKSILQLNSNEKHVMCKLWHNRRFDRAVSSEIKEMRHIPDDPYKVYNDFSWQNYHSVKLKNMERVKRYGAKNFNFPHHVAHYKKHNQKADRRKPTWYEPPGYHRDIASGVYRPDVSKPQDIMPPDYLLVERHESNVGKTHERKYWRELKKLEQFTGPIPLTSKLRLPVVGTRIG